MITGAMKVGLMALVAAAGLGGLPQRTRYDSKIWYVDTEPQTKPMEVIWERVFAVEGEGSAKMLHIPDKFSYVGRTIEIVQKDEMRDFDVRKEIVTSPAEVPDYIDYLRNLHMLAADMCLEERYTAGTKHYAMDGYSVETEQLIDGTFIGTITLYTRNAN